MNPISCPVCQTSAAAPIISLGGSGATFLLCRTCGHRFAEIEDIKASQRVAMYDEEYSGYREDPFFQEVVRQQLRSVFASRQPQGRILDIGCGNGAFLAEARNLGYDVMGIDTSEAAVRFTKRRGIPAVTGDFITAEFHDLFDFITMWDVIEHLAEPRSFVERAFELLPAGGFLVIKTPFVGAPAFYATLGAGRLAAVFLQFPSHIQFFSKSSLNHLLNSIGYQSVEWLPGQRMRDKRPLSSIRAVAGRVLRFAVGLLGGNTNLYVVAKK